MQQRDEKPEQARVNPAARRDRPGQPHEDLARSDRPEDEAVQGYQKAELDPRDQSGIAE